MGGRERREQREQRERRERRERRGWHALAGSLQ